ncbi:hypothetical protein EVA_18677 [gut metagenome]|uniref:Uncharacterized protein n=1 Tax=gut metagenome TaxID=749906 RepID=J9C077_9ZZZZ
MATSWRRKCSLSITYSTTLSTPLRPSWVVQRFLPKLVSSKTLWIRLITSFFAVA